MVCQTLKRRQLRLPQREWLPNEAFIQNVSIFAIGYAEHFSTDTGGDQSVTNSNSNFGAVSLEAVGFRPESAVNILTNVITFLNNHNFDDAEEVIVHRLKVYHDQTAPIIDYYRTEGSLITISATGAVDEITKRAIAALGNK